MVNQRMAHEYNSTIMHKWQAYFFLLRRIYGLCLILAAAKIPKPNKLQQQISILLLTFYLSK